MFNDIIVANFSCPRFAEELPDPSLVLELGNPVCGDRIRVQLAVQGARIASARYQAWGCATSLAAGNIFCGHADGRTIAEVTAATQDEIAAMLGELEPSQHHCLEMLQSLFAQLRDKTALLLDAA